jgi:hypothetical protein
MPILRYDAREDAQVRPEGERLALTPVGVALREGLGFEEWLAVGRQLLRIADASAWWIGDWLAYGEWRYGHKYRLAVERLQLNYHSIRDYVYVASRVGRGVRRADLSFTHHRQVAKLSPAEQQEWLERAAQAKWSTRELADAIERGAAETARRLAVSTQLRLKVERSRLDVWDAAARTAGLDLARWATTALDEAAGRAALVAPVTSRSVV